jgi:hypothetical protein
MCPQLSPVLQAWKDPTLYPSALDCKLDIYSWAELTRLHKEGNLTFTTGSMGASSVPNIYLTWVCVKDYDPWFLRYVITFKPYTISCYVTNSLQRIFPLSIIQLQRNLSS